MKTTKIFSLLIGMTMGVPMCTLAQEVATNATTLAPGDSITFIATSSGDAVASPQLTAPLALPSPVRPSLMYGITPFPAGGYANWELHEGFNASLGMNLSIGVGHNRLHGVGFGQDAAFLYALPLNNRLSVAGGVYATNMDWGNYTYRNVGVTGIAAYRATERITIYGYGSKSLMPRHLAPIYPLPNYCPDRWGGMVNFKVGEHSSFSIGFEAYKSETIYGY